MVVSLSNIIYVHETVMGCLLYFSICGHDVVQVLLTVAPPEATVQRALPGRCLLTL